MPDSEQFDFDRPSRDTLAGIYVEASDASADGCSPPARRGPDAAVEAERLFGITVTVSDQDSAARSAQ
jgi:hypothetical protein